MRVLVRNIDRVPFDLVRREARHQAVKPLQRPELAILEKPDEAPAVHEEPAQRRVPLAKVSLDATEEAPRVRRGIKTEQAERLVGTDVRSGRVARGLPATSGGDDVPLEPGVIRNARVSVDG